MYKPDRIGPHLITDLDLAGMNDFPTTWKTATNYNLVDSDLWERHPNFRTATVRDDFDTWTQVPDVTMNVAADKAVSWAVAINGEAPSDEGTLYSVQACGIAGISSGGGLALPWEVWIGRLDAATPDITRTAQNNAVTNYRPLPASQTWNIDASGIWCNLSAIHVDSADDGHGSNPIVAGITLFNIHASAAQALNFLSVNINIHRYAAELPIFDPVR